GELAVAGRVPRQVGRRLVLGQLALAQLLAGRHVPNAEAVDVLALVHAAGGQQLAVGRVGQRDAVDVRRDALQLGTGGDVEEDERAAGRRRQRLAVRGDRQGQVVVEAPRVD